MNLFSDVRASLAIRRINAKQAESFAPKSRTESGTALSGGGVAVGGHTYILRGSEDAGLLPGEVIEVLNIGRPAAANYREINQSRRLRDKLPYQQSMGLMLVEEDGSDAAFNVNQLVFPAGTLTYNGGGSVSVATGTGSGTGGCGELLFWMPGALTVGTQPMTLHNRVKDANGDGVTLHIHEIFVDVSDPATGGGIGLSIGGVGSITVDAGNTTAQASADADFAYGSTLSVSVTQIGTGMPGGNVLIHLPYTYE
jgi:hypothetical protein